MSQYPKRESHHAHRLTRLLFKSCACQDLGHYAVLLVIHVAHTEDAARYQGPVRFWNSQLRDVLGFRSPKQLVESRRRAIDAGWLVYERDHDRSVGRYWTLIPASVSRFDDLPIESITVPSAEQKTEQETHSRSAGGTLCGTGTGTGTGTPSYPIPIPNPKRRGVAASVVVPDSLKTPEFQAAWCDWQRHRREIGKTLKPTAIKKQLAELVAMGPIRAAAAINYSITKGYTGIFEKQIANGKPSPSTSEQIRQEYPSL